MSKLRVLCFCSQLSNCSCLQISSTKSIIENYFLDAVKEEGYEKIIPDPFAGDESVINLHQWAPIYGVLYIDLISVPPQPITANGWIMKQGFIL